MNSRVVFVLAVLVLAMTATPAKADEVEVSDCGAAWGDNIAVAFDKCWSTSTGIGGHSWLAYSSAKAPVATAQYDGSFTFGPNPSTGDFECRYSWSLRMEAAATGPLSYAMGYQVGDSTPRGHGDDNAPPVVVDTISGNRGGIDEGETVTTWAWVEDGVGDRVTFSYDWTCTDPSP